ncbi:MAG: DNA primase [Anaerolineae bacterium]|nr:DNA primase [Anaerolineae bacterium]
MSVTDEIKSRLDIVDVIGETVQLRRSGKSYTGFCPFHQNTRTPAFVVFPDSQTWRCFGACAEGGDLFSFVMKKEGGDFKEALRVLAQRAGVTLDESPAARQQKEEDRRLVDLLTLAADYFHQLLLYSPQAETARRYIDGRALEEETVAAFKLGYSLESWDACRTHFSAQGYADDDLLAAGLLTENPDRGTRYDRFRNRLMIPIRDPQGQVVGFGARSLDPDGIPKYLNSPQTDLFDKSRLLFGLDVARRHIREAHQAVIVEGYMDVMQGWQTGFRNIIAQMGTALTEQQLRLLKRYTRRFVIALDSDAAGVQATMRSLDVARETLDRDVDIRFDARGLVHHEGRLKADIRVLTLPTGTDPDDLLRRDPTLWPRLVEKAKPIVTYVIDTLAAEANLDDAKAKADIVRKVMPLINDVADAVERDHYRQTLSRTLHVDERALQQVALATSVTETSRQHRRDRARVDAAVAPQPQPVPGVAAMTGGRIALTIREADFLRHCLRSLSLLRAVDDRLHEEAQPPVSEDDFSSAEDRALFRFLRLQTQRRAVATIDELWDSLDGVLLTRVQSLLDNAPGIADAELERLPDSLAQLILDLRLERIRRLLSEVQQLFREARQEGDAATREMYMEQLQILPLDLQRINRARWAMSPVSRRKAEETGH